MATFGTFVAGQVLTAAELNSLGVWTSFTPAYTNLTTGNGTNVGYYTVINKMLFVNTSFTLGSTSSVGDPVSLTLPASLTTISSIGATVGSAVFNDAGVATYTGVTQVISTTKVQPYVFNVSATYSTISSLNATRPFTAGTGDQYFMEFMVQLT